MLFILWMNSPQYMSLGWWRTGVDSRSTYRHSIYGLSLQGVSPWLWHAPASWRAEAPLESDGSHSQNRFPGHDDGLLFWSFEIFCRSSGIFHNLNDIFWKKLYAKEVICYYHINIYNKHKPRKNEPIFPQLQTQTIYQPNRIRTSEFIPNLNHQTLIGTA